jgi:glyoxylase-like metal-dependent hydrolase (beta-lactamase superfamily II)
MSNRIHVLDFGAVRVDENFIVSNSTIVTQSNPSAISRLVDVPISGFLIESPIGNILYDTGCHPECMGPNGRWTARHQEEGPFLGGSECTLPARLKELGLGPDQIVCVVLSHLHNDHAGCVEFFDKSKIIVHEDEFAGALRQFALHNDLTNYVLKDVAAWIERPRNWELISRDEPFRDLAEGVRVLNFGSGHAYGMLGLAVKLRARPGFLLVSDACYGSANYGSKGRRAGIIHDTIGYEKTLRFIERYAEKESLEVLFGHDADQFAKLINSPSGSYD